MIPMFKVHMPECGSEVVQTLMSGYISEGPKVEQFESLLSKYLGNHNVCTVNNCTSGLTLSLIAAGVKPGDYVITSPMTCMASNMPIHTLGAKIVWADVDPETGNISAQSVAERSSELSQKGTPAKAVLYVHWGGQPADIEAISAVSKSYGLKVIEDCAHALGATYDGNLIGNHGDFCCFSFQAIKHITTGDGGCVTTNGPDAENSARRISRMRWYGLDRKFSRSLTKWHADIDDVGFKMHMNDLSATIGIAQMAYVDWIVNSHRKNAKFFDAELSMVPGITTLRRDPRSQTSSWLYTFKLDSEEEREKFVAHMTNSGIACNVVHVRNDQYSVFEEYVRDLPGVDDFCSRMINIPCGWWLTDEDRQYIVDSIKKGW